MPVNKNMQEWIDKLESLERNKISAPFIHLWAFI